MFLASNHLHGGGKKEVCLWGGCLPDWGPWGLRVTSGLVGVDQPAARPPGGGKTSAWSPVSGESARLAGRAAADKGWKAGSGDAQSGAGLRTVPAPRRAELGARAARLHWRGPTASAETWTLASGDQSPSWSERRSRRLSGPDCPCDERGPGRQVGSKEPKVSQSGRRQMKGAGLSRSAPRTFGVVLRDIVSASIAQLPPRRGGGMPLLLSTGARQEAGCILCL